MSLAPSSSVIPPFKLLSQIPCDIEVDFQPENDGDSIAHCNLSCGRFVGDDITFHMTKCLHVVCGSCRDQFGEFEGRPVCPVCQGPWSGVEISGLEDRVVQTYFQDPFERIEAILEEHAQYENFYEDQMEKFNKLFLEVTDRHKKACTENLAWTVELKNKEDKMAQLDHEIQYLKERKRQLESILRSGRGPQGSQYHTQEENSHVRFASQNSPAAFASQNSHAQFASQNFQGNAIPMTPRDYQSQAPPEDFIYQATPSQVHIQLGSQRSRFNPQNGSHQMSQQFQIQHTAKRSHKSNRSSHHSNLVPIPPPAPVPCSHHDGSHRSSGHRSLVQRHVFHFQRTSADLLETHDPTESPRFLKPTTPGEGLRRGVLNRSQMQASQSQRQYDPYRFYNIDEATGRSPVGSYGNVSSQWSRSRL